MAIDLSVHRVSDDDFFSSPPPAASAEFDTWFEECEKRTLYHHPVASDGVFWEYWHEPARKLGLHLIGQIQDGGLKASGDTLRVLAQETYELDRYWSRLDLDNKQPLICATFREDHSQVNSLQPIRENLQERMGALRKAIAVAQAEDGVVSIG